jgi:hypothetical protein
LRVKPGAAPQEDPPMADNPSPADTVSFETQIKPLFREKDQHSMAQAFDLWSCDSVSAHADAILARLRAGTMPCDGAWPASQVDLFQRWIDDGKRP